MGKVSVINKKRKKLYIVLDQIKFPEMVQEKIFDYLEAGQYDNFLSVSIAKKKKKKTLLKSENTNLINLVNYFKQISTKKDYLYIVSQLISIIKSCDNYLLNIDNIELNPEAVFIEPHTYKVKCIYWPVVNNQTYIKPRDFFKELMEIANFGSSDSGEWIREYNLFLNSLKPFSINNFEKLITKLQGKEVHTAEISPASTILTSNFTENESTNNVKTLKKNQIYDPLKPSVAKNRVVRRPQSANTVKVKPTTKVISRNTNASTANAYLIRAKSKEKIYIAQDKFVLGKSKTDADYLIDNPAISRVHAVISKHNGLYYIQDNKSTNRTFVNKKVIQPYKDVEIKDGDTIKLANESFVFHLE